jgi:hydrogenase maturation protein HypF
VYRIATELGLGGHVGNDPRGVFIEIEGPLAALDRFADRLETEHPPLARVASVESADIQGLGDRAFVIRHSSFSGEQKVEISPDVATCVDCLREMSDPSDRRYRYPFINCTNCGPRYSIVKEVPYDRPRTTMVKFPMCPDCQAEYDDPADRRFHAQPNACHVCGPRVWLADAGGDEIQGITSAPQRSRRDRPGDAIRLAAEWLHDGRIVAVKGLGGFHLAVRADHDGAVVRLRERKGREAKPFALMVGTLDEVRKLVRLDETAEASLTSWRRPIMLAPKLPDFPAGAGLSTAVAPASGSFGIMLPYTPLHHLLFAEGLPPLVMTSANPTDEPLCAENAEALRRLSRIADGFLMHDRDIGRRVDDSVAIAVEKPGPIVVPLRRARGFAPEPIDVPQPAPEPVLAVGGDMKAAVCVLNDRDAVLSEHLGELSNPAAYRNFTGTIDKFKGLLRVEPRVVACDLHPEYASARYARKLGLRTAAVQHHHAHVVACMAENGLTGPVVGVAADGTGYGTDGAVWGCEVMVADEAEFERTAHLAYYPLVGGDAAALDTWRPAAGLLYETFGDDWVDASGFAFERVDDEAVRLVRKRLATGAGVSTSSLGRLFDAVAFLLGVCDRNRYEAEAAMSLETLAAGSEHAEALPFELHERGGGALEMDFRPMIRAVVGEAKAGMSRARLARAFHETVAHMLADSAARAAGLSDPGRVVLSCDRAEPSAPPNLPCSQLKGRLVRGRRPRVALTGGCFANRLLLARTSDMLQDAGVAVHVHRHVPTGDGGIALGQAVSAAARLSRGSI